MQVRVVGGNGMSATDAFNALIYRPPDEQLSNYLSSNMQRVADMAGNASARFLDTTKAMYDKFNNSALINASKALVHSLGQHTNQNVIMPLSYDNMGTANLLMQQYIIAHPTVNKMYHDNMCYGFEASYFNTEPEVYGKDRNDYRRVMDGAVQFEDDEAYTIQYTSGDDYEDLDSMDQFAIRDTWLNVERMLAGDIDPTDPDRGEL